MNVLNLAISVRGAAAKSQGVSHGRSIPADLDSLGADELLSFDDASESSKQSLNAADHGADDDDKALPAADSGQNSCPSPGVTPVLFGLVQPTLPPELSGGSALGQTQGTTQDSTAIVAGLASTTEEWAQEGSDSGGPATRLRALTLSTAPRLFRISLGAEQTTAEVVAVAAAAQACGASEGAGTHETGTAGTASSAGQTETQGQADQTVTVPTGGSVPSSDQQHILTIAVSKDLLAVPSALSAVTTAQLQGASSQPPIIAGDMARPGPAADTSSLHESADDGTPGASNTSVSQDMARGAGARAKSAAQSVDEVMTALHATTASAAMTASERGENGTAPVAQALPPEAAQKILSELAQAVKVLVSGNALSTDVHVDSTALGSVDMRLTPSGSGTTLQISCDNPAVAAVVQDGLPALHAMLGQVGMGEVSVNLTSDALEPVGASVARDNGEGPLASGRHRSADGNAEGESSTHPAMPKHERDAAAVVPVAGQPAPAEHSIDASVAPSGLGEGQQSTRQQNEMLDQVVRAAAQLATSHQESARIDLNPPSLGRLELRMAIGDGKAHIHIVAENPETRDALVTNLPQLREALKDQGLVADRLSVSMGFGFDGSSWQPPSTNQSPWRQGRMVPVDREPQPVAAVAAEVEHGRERVRVGAGVVDLYA